MTATVLVLLVAAAAGMVASRLGGAATSLVLTVLALTAVGVLVHRMGAS